MGSEEIQEVELAWAGGAANEVREILVRRTVRDLSKTWERRGEAR